MHAAAVERLRLIPVVPLATALAQGSEQSYKNSDSGEGVADARQPWLELRQQMANKAQLEEKIAALQKEQEEKQRYAQERAAALEQVAIAEKERAQIQACLHPITSSPDPDVT